MSRDIRSMFQLFLATSLLLSCSAKERGINSKQASTHAQKSSAAATIANPPAAVTSSPSTTTPNATTPPAASSIYPFVDSFGTQLEGRWDIIEGAVSVDQGSLLFSKELTTIALVKGPALENSVIDAQISVSGDKHSVGLVSRYSKNSAGVESMYLAILVLRNQIAFVELWRQSGAGLTNMNFKVLDRSVVDSYERRLRLSISSDTLTVFVDGVMHIEQKDSELLPAGRAGVRAFATSSRLGDFSVYNSESSRTSYLPFSSSFTLPDLSLPFSPWLQTAGSAEIKSQKLHSSGDVPGIATVDGIKSMNVKLQADVTVAATSSDSRVALVARHRGPRDQNMIIGELKHANNKTFLSILAQNGTQWLPLAQREVEPTEGKLIFEVSGSHLKLSLTASGKVYDVSADVRTPEFIVAGAVGVRFLGEATIDDFSARSIGLGF
jgi:hypothetical protein